MALRAGIDLDKCYYTAVCKWLLPRMKRAKPPVKTLAWAADKLDPVWPGGMDYVKINVILFCVVLPVVLLASLGLNLAFLMG